MVGTRGCASRVERVSFLRTSVYLIRSVVGALRPNWPIRFDDVGWRASLSDLGSTVACITFGAMADGNPTSHAAFDAPESVPCDRVWTCALPSSA